jgi:Ca2+-binding EF-hand superfamily protein
VRDRREVIDRHAHGRRPAHGALARAAWRRQGSRMVVTRPSVLRTERISMRFLLLLATLVATPALAQDRVAIPAGSGNGSNPIGLSTRAQPSPTVIVEPVAMMIAAFDSDGDAKVTRAEFDAGLRHSFDSIDTDRKGSIGYIAFSDWSERWLGDRNTLPSPFEVDRDGDNRITFAELAERFDLLFTRFDANKDGVIVRSELVTIRPQMFSPSQGRGKGKRGGQDGKNGN